MDSSRFHLYPDREALKGKNLMSDRRNSVILVLVTVGSDAEGKAIASALVDQNLAACVSQFPIHSTYRWQGEIQSEPEWQLMIKTEPGQFEAITTLVRSLHSYDLPEIIAIPVVQGFAPYLSWVQAQSKPTD
jgi:periplasmic divalent cation tolerance protein